LSIEKQSEIDLLLNSKIVIGVHNMKKILILGLILDFSGIAFADVQVNGYYKSNGTYVQPYVRTSPNSTKLDNYSTKGNYNPYTGQQGTLNVNTPQQNYGYNSGYSNNNSYGGYYGR
jgi:hypothetical protein